MGGYEVWVTGWLPTLEYGLVSGVLSERGSGWVGVGGFDQESSLEVQAVGAGQNRFKTEQEPRIGGVIPGREEWLRLTR
jgi:hypothetical protein